MIRRLVGILGLLALSACASHSLKLRDDGLHLYLKAPAAKRVGFAASSEGYAPRPATRLKHGRWEVVMPRGAGFSYYYLIDGQAYTPDCRYREQDDFGGLNCVYQP